MSAARMRFLYTLNIIVPGWLAVLHLLSPKQAAQLLWGGAEHSLALPMLGGFWAAIAVLSVGGLMDPLKFSPVMLVQILYKIFFLTSTVLPLVLEGRWSAFPVAPMAVFASYLPLLLLCAPWGYLLSSKGREGASKKAE